MRLGSGRFRHVSSTRRPHGDTARFTRELALERLATEEFDLLVIGGGVTGAGVALDAASRGLRTALVERGDFAAGTSSKSSKLIHGGLRYLQQREIRLVYENLAERQRLLENAPHLVSPLPFLIPLFGRDGSVSKAVARSYSTALWLYDVTGGLRIGRRHRRISRVEALQHLPLLKTDRLVAGFLYYDARADDARLTLTVARTAALEYGAAVVNYAAVDGFLTDATARVVGARVRPILPSVGRATGGGPSGRATSSRARSNGNPSAVGAADADGRVPPDAGDRADPADRGDGVIEVRAAVVVNATGVWADAVDRLHESAPVASLRPAKGVHVTVPAHRMPCDIASVIPVPHDKRSIFVVPWTEGDLTYIGTTDTEYDGPLEAPGCTPEDVDYLLGAVNALTTAGLTRDDVVGVWAGLRPLLAPAPGRRMSARTSDLSRRHTVRTSANGMVTVTGGKLTTYRKMAEDTVDAVLTALPGAPRRPCVTRHLRLLGAPPPNRADGAPGPDGADADPGGETPRSGVPAPAPLAPGVMTHLADRYGTEAADVVAVAEGRPELLRPIVEGLPYIGAEVVYAARAEMAQTVVDVLSRRTRALLQDARGCVAAALAVAELLAPELGWEQARIDEEVSAFVTSALGELAAAGVGAGAAALGEHQ